MKKIIRPVALLLLWCLFVFAANQQPSALTFLPKNSAKADSLKTLCLLSGDSDGEFHLERGLNRAEMAVMLVRLLGKADEVQSGSYSHPFTDVRKTAAWANNYVGYLYENGLVAGKSGTVYGAKDPTTFKQYAAVVLRILGYSEAAGDFSYQNTPETAVMTGLLSYDECDDLLTHPIFYRDDMVLVSYNALFTKIKNASEILLSRLEPLLPTSALERAAISDQNFDNYINNVYDYPLTSKERNELLKKAVFRLEAKDASGTVTSGQGFLVSEDGTALTCCHLLYNARSASALFADGTRCDVASVAGYNLTADLAVIKLSSGKKFPFLSQSGTLFTGEGSSFEAGYINRDSTVNTHSCTLTGPSVSTDGDYRATCFEMSPNPPEGSDGAPIINGYGEVLALSNSLLKNSKSASGVYALPFYYYSHTARDQIIPVDVFGPAAASVRQTRKTVGESEPNNTPDNAQSVLGNTTVSAGLSAAGDTDCYCFKTPIRLNLSVTAYTTSSTLIKKSTLQLMDESGKELAKGKPASGGANILEINYNDLPPGTYTIRFGATQGETPTTPVNYTLSLMLR